ncbi:type II toxin-antitoxin system RelE/ParE family toxin [Williamwhitmania taraxaci]|uniref:Plasmid stabilization system protein ParE n=1 Tax=Williamwhitmania taraxaci TaxID=1640674 RepID=A0A1G6QM19_9BACT|nr:type II toxin-antitoxin system RelE/ParE family toxin [Williamwhitmania taraxaci]SDC92756.1 Plasmid stabilization system protein ParE [Williamwhitmania taraxaci]
MVAKKAKVIISNLARASLRSHIEYLKKEVSEETAEYVKQGILAKCAALPDFSGYSKERYLENESTDYRSVTQWDYNIIYTVVQGEVRILNIIHTSLHPDKRKEI